MATTQTVLGVEFPSQIFINGEWVKGTGEPLDVYNPATEELLATIDTASVADVDLAVKAARAAFETTWGLNTPSATRGRLLFKFADIIEANSEMIVKVEAANNGKPTKWVEAELGSSLAAIRFFAGAADKVSGSTIEVDDNSKQVFTRREPIGVVAHIVPWNFPLMMWAWKIAPALASGCTVVFKTAEATPLSVLILTKLMQEVGFPKGAFNLVSGVGKVTGQALAEHPDVDKIAFTGSTAIGKHLASTAALSNLKVVTLELGGKSPNIIFSSANLQEAARWAAFGLFETGGQSCIVGSRILVQDTVYDEFLKLFVAAVKEIKVGKDDDSFYGSLISKVQFDKVLKYIETGKKEAKLETGGGRVGDKGYFVQPTVFSGVTNDMVIGREEIFGPVASVLKFSTEAEAIAIANDTSYGLASAIHSTDASQLPRVSRKLKAGTVWLNCYSPLHPSVPFGGYKSSGWGRELGMNGLEAYLTTKTVHQYFGEDLQWPFKL
ncbi:putative aldehyde dehydrogenase [Mrakia frigida]|uniref:putative aldehyde dehydrogenase n=1 Tax=Mrakia frigida TaxID=29902 RepID=UPI003FCC0B5E